MARIGVSGKVAALPYLQRLLSFLRDRGQKIRWGMVADYDLGKGIFTRAGSSLRTKASGWDLQLSSLDQIKTLFLERGNDRGLTGLIPRAYFNGSAGA